MQFDYYNNTTPINDMAIEGYIKVDVIASFKSDGRFIPLKVRIEMNNERNTYDVVVARHIENKDYVTYHCYFDRLGSRYPIDLLYLIKQHIWVTPSHKA